MFFYYFFALNVAEEILNKADDGTLENPDRNLIQQNIQGKLNLGSPRKIQNESCSEDQFKELYGEIKWAKVNCRHKKGQKSGRKNKKIFCDVTCENASLRPNFKWLPRYRRIKCKATDKATGRYRWKPRPSRILEKADLLCNPKLTIEHKCSPEEFKNVYNITSHLLKFKQVPPLASAYSWELSRIYYELECDSIEKDGEEVKMAPWPVQQVDCRAKWHQKQKDLHARWTRVINSKLRCVQEKYVLNKPNYDPDETRD